VSFIFVFCVGLNMKATMKTVPQGGRFTVRMLKVALLAPLYLFPAGAHASMFHGETLDAIADVMTWVVLVVAPVVAIGVFLLVHILPEKIAENKHHPQTAAIQCLCLLSLVFGGMLWPLAWLWAYTRPVLHQLAYGTDKVVHGEEGHAQPATEVPVLTNGDTKMDDAKKDDTPELNQLRARIAELESKLAGAAIAEPRKA
jgi:hypothetical protein